MFLVFVICNVRRVLKYRGVFEYNKLREVKNENQSLIKVLRVHTYFSCRLGMASQKSKNFEINKLHLDSFVPCQVNLLDLPDETLLKIFKNVKFFKNRATISLVCRRFYKICTDREMIRNRKIFASKIFQPNVTFLCGYIPAKTIKMSFVEFEDWKMNDNIHKLKSQYFRYIDTVTVKKPIKREQFEWLMRFLIFLPAVTHLEVGRSVLGSICWPASCSKLHEILINCFMYKIKKITRMESFEKAEPEYVNRLFLAAKNLKKHLSGRSIKILFARWDLTVPTELMEQFKSSKEYLKFIILNPNFIDYLN